MTLLIGTLPAFLVPAGLQAPLLTRLAPAQRSYCLSMMSSPPTSASPGSASLAALTMYDMPWSNFAARIRYLARRKNLPPSLFTHLPVTALPEHNGESFPAQKEFLAPYTPTRKIPFMLIAGSSGDGTLPKSAAASGGGGDAVLFESVAMCEYIIERFPGYAPAFLPPTAEGRARTRLVATLLETYVTENVKYMYLPLPGDRSARIAALLTGLDAVEHALHEKGPFAAGNELSLADCCLWGSWPYLQYMLPTFYGVTVENGRPKLGRWAHAMANESEAARETFREVFRAIDEWWDRGVWSDWLKVPALTERPRLPF